MIEFCSLYWRLDSTTKTNDKIAALVDYFESADARDLSWAIYFLTGRRLKRLIGVRQLAQWAIELTQISDWLFEECYDRVGDLAETISLILPPSESPKPIPLHLLVEEHLFSLKGMPPVEQRSIVMDLWKRFDQQQLFILGKLMTGGFRVGVSKRLVTRALAKKTGLDASVIAHRLMGDWEPTEQFYQQLVAEDDGETNASKPYPFFLANPLKSEPQSLGTAHEWVAEWKWDGIRAQVIRRDGCTFIWSRGEDLVTEQFPEVVETASQLPAGTVLDGEILGWSPDEERPLEFSQLQRRLGRKKLGPKMLQQVPVVFLAFDLLEDNGHEIRELPLVERQNRLAKIIANLTSRVPEQSGSLFPMDDPESRLSIRIPPSIEADSWEHWSQIRETSKQNRAEGLMLKRKSSPYQVGRPVGDWWKWKIDPLTVDAVLIYAQRGHGRRASLYTDYTFAVWDQDELVPFAKAYSGLSDEEIKQVDAFVRRNTHERFGPVRSVTPELVFELAFENIQRSTRHKSGIAVRFPRITRWRHDKTPREADSLSSILALLEEQ